MDSLMHSQMFTQPSGVGNSQQRKGGSDRFIDTLIIVSNKNKLVENMLPNQKATLTFNLKILLDDTKWKRMCSILRDSCSADKGTRLFNFARAWFKFIHAVPEKEDEEKLRANMMMFLLDTLMEQDVSVTEFFGMYNDFAVQLSNISKESLLIFVDHIMEELKRKKANEEVDKENTETSEVTRERKFNQRWKDFVSLVIKRMGEMDKLEYNEQELSGAETASKILFHWLRIVDNEYAFELLAEIACSYSFASSAIEKFCDEVVAEEIMMDLSSDQEIEKKKRADLTWKAIILTTKTDKDRMNRLFNAVLVAWEIQEPDEEDDEEEQEAKPVCLNRELTEDLTRCLMVGARVLNTSVDVSKKFLNLIRNEKHRILGSEFGFSLALVQCGLDRNDSLADMKKTLQKLWRVGEQAEECVWMSEIVCGKLLKTVDTQLRTIAGSMSKNETIRKLLSKPMFALMLSLLDTPAYKKQVVIVDGRVADGCALWLMSRDNMILICQSQTDMAAQLSHLFQAIGSASNNSSALVLIDVLRELVKKCCIEILNNSKLIDGLFDYVCRMRRDISVSLIRCLLPIINTRPQLRAALFKCLQKDLLCETTVCSAVPIVLMLLKSVSKRREDGGGGKFDHSMSQSFGSFNTQTLNIMGCKKIVDQNVGLELIGIVKRCLWQPSTTKIVLYDGICELATQTTTMLNQFLDMLLSHARTAPDWNMAEMVTANKSFVQLTEPMPHLIQTVECLMSELASFDPEFKLDGSELLLKQAVAQLESWVSDATRKDISDLGLDRNAEWSMTTVGGRSNLLFAQMMLSVYDVLIEHMWRLVEEMDRKEDVDRLIALLNRRKELDKIYKDKLAARRENKTTSSPDSDKQKEAVIPIDTSQTEILTSAKSLASIMSKLLTTRNGDDTSGNNTTLNVRPEILSDVQTELLSWTVSRAKVLSTAIIKEYRPLHSIVSGTNSLVSLSKNLLQFFVAEDTPTWMNEISIGTIVKTTAIESYANIIQFLALKYKVAPMKIAMMWFEEKEDEDEESRRKRMDQNVLVLRHAHYLSCRLYRHVLNGENDDVEEDKPPKALFETQGKTILIAAMAVLNMSKNSRVWANVFKRAAKLLADETFYNNQMLKEYCKFVTNCALRCGDSDKTVMDTMKSVLESIMVFLSEEGDENKFKFISKHSLTVSIEFVFSFVEKTLGLIKEAFVFLKDFCVKPPFFDDILEALLMKCAEVTETVSRVLQLFVQYKLMQERVTEVMTNYFSTIQLSVLLLQGLTKPWGREMVEWKSVDFLANLVNSKLTPILAMVDDHIGFSKGKDEMKKKISQKSRYQKSRRDEKLYVKFSHEREAVQHSILVLCKLIKDERFDLQIKNNSIGYRDFRIDMDLIRSKLGCEENSELTQSRKRRHAESEDEGSDNNEQEQDDDESDNDSTSRGSRGADRSITTNENKEKARGGSEETTRVEVKQEAEDNPSRSDSPVF